MDLRKIMGEIVDISRVAGEKIMNVYERSDFGIERKEDNSPLTLADRAANEYITNELKQRYPEFGMLSEECKDTKERLVKKHVWIIDPLDGTKEFIKRNGEFTVNIALVEDKKPIIGVVYVPVTNEVYYAARGCGAFYCAENGDEMKIETSEKRDTRDMILMKSRSHASEKLLRIIETFKFAKVMERGSSLKICQIAIGNADVYFRFGLTSEWDICAAHCILEEARGKITDCLGSDILYNREDILNRKGFIASNGELQSEFTRAAMEML